MDPMFPFKHTFKMKIVENWKQCIQISSINNIKIEIRKRNEFQEMIQNEAGKYRIESNNSKIKKDKTKIEN